MTAINNIPIIAYGEGSGYNSGIVPIYPSVIITLKGLNKIYEPFSKNNKTYITAQTGVVYTDLLL